MRKLLAIGAGLAALTLAPAAMAQGIGIQVPGVGVQIGDPNPPRHGHGYVEHYDERDYDRPRYREREVYLDQRECKTVTIHQDGVTKRIRRCD